MWILSNPLVSRGGKDKEHASSTTYFRLLCINYCDTRHHEWFTDVIAPFLDRYKKVVVRTAIVGCAFKREAKDYLSTRGPCYYPYL
jgi:hypothetical protein